jgi:hypothetical protein
MGAVGSGKTLDEAIFNAVAGLTDPQGHSGSLTFDSFEVVNIKGKVAHNPGDHGTPGSIEVMIRAAGSHQG